MVYFNPALPIITLNVSGLSIPILKQIIKLGKKSRPPKNVLFTKNPPEIGRQS